MSSASVLGIASTALAAAGAAPYILGIIRGHRPPYSTYLGWLVVGSTAFVFHMKTIPDGEPLWSILLPATFAAIPAVYLVMLIYFRAKPDFQIRDLLTMCIAGLAWMAWIATASADGATTLATLIAVLVADFMTSLPILQDAHAGKESTPEGRLSWVLSSISAVCGFLAVSNFNGLEVVYPAYLVCVMTTMAVFSCLRPVAMDVAK